MEQLDLKLRNPDRVNVNDMIDERTKNRYGEPSIRYIGEAVQQFDGTYRCLADVRGSLCVVEVKIKRLPDSTTG